MNEEVSNISAAKFREEGNALYRRKEFFQALICYNKSLCFSETNALKSLAFANRSAVYLEAKKYQHCLENIQMARDYEYPQNKSSTLNKREAKCLDLMKNHEPDSLEDPWNFFKLSYPANKKLPFVVECLELRENSKFGRHIVTNRDLKPGDIIAIEEPWLKHLNWNHCYERCSKCLKINFHSLIPCKGRCVTTMFCSEKCADSAGPRHHRYECAVNQLPETTIKMQKLLIESINIAGGINELQAYIEDNDKLTIFDIDMRNPEDPDVKKKQLKAFLNLTKKPKLLEGTNKIVTVAMCYTFWRHLWDTPEEFDRLLQTSHLLVSICERNYYDVDSPFLSKKQKLKHVHSGSSLSLFGAFFNHSCDSNVSWLNIDEKHVSIVDVPIKAGEQLFVCYRGSYLNRSREGRKAILFNSFQFVCDCNACINDFKPSCKTRITDEKFKIPSFTSLSLDPIKDFKKNCKYIQENFKNHPCRETICLKSHNRRLLLQIINSGSLKA